MTSLIDRARHTWLADAYRRSLGVVRRLRNRAHRMPTAAIEVSGPGVTRQAKALRAALDDATAGLGGPSVRTRRIDGMSGQRSRTMLNRLIAHLSAEGTPRYLEIGCWKGSTAAAAMDGNRLAITCVDNWSQFDGPKSEFLANVGRVSRPTSPLNFSRTTFERLITTDWVLRSMC